MGAVLQVLGAADVLQVLLLGSHGGGLQRLRVALQRVQLLPLAVHVVLMALQVRRLEQQRDVGQNRSEPVRTATAVNGRNWVGLSGGLHGNPARRMNTSGLTCR